MWIWIKRQIQDFNSWLVVWHYLLYHLRFICVLSCSFAVSSPFWSLFFPFYLSSVISLLICYHFYELILWIRSVIMFLLCSFFIFALDLIQNKGFTSMIFRDWIKGWNNVNISHKFNIVRPFFGGDIFVYFSGNDVQIMMKIIWLLRFSFQISDFHNTKVNNNPSYLKRLKNAPRLHTIFFYQSERTV